METSDTVIHLLEPELANKIAAGEVVDRPASVVKELLDNAIDSGADQIDITIKNAGRTLIQVTDNGCGMSKQDLHLCFQRHATSKIRSVDDLYNIRTLGFRGEAMASIASVSQINVKTRRLNDDSGWEITIHGGKESAPEPTASEQGTTIAVRNLFFNVPARRAFLKTDATELRHIIIAVQQAALAHPEISFSLLDEKEIIYKLPSGSLADRITAIFGKPYRASLLPVEESTSVVTLKGYLIDPKLAKKNRGEQFLFVNGRPFMHRHLNYIIQNEYSVWTGKDMYPFYALFFEVDPSRLDVNVHPSKLEVKFDDERSISTFTRSIIKRALNERFQVPDFDRFTESDNEIGKRSSVSGFSSGGFSIEGGFGNSSGSREYRDQQNRFFTDHRQMGATRRMPDGKLMMEKLYASGMGQEPTGEENSGDYDNENIPQFNLQPAGKRHFDRGSGFWQLHDQYIISQTRSGMFIVDQYFAHMRILYEKSIGATEGELPGTQQLLFPQTIDFSASDFAILTEALPTLKKIGFNIQLLSGNSALISGVPADLKMGDEKPILESILHQYQHYSGPVKLTHREKLVLAFASNAAVPRGKKLGQQEMEALVDQLFACDQPFKDPLNRPTVVFIPLDDIQKKFR
ncbi:MAG: DNA mismatch repair endonuclease MutL [Balneolales bacterium]|nr:DNA mismatch repair endonuclease MutL [Balneolales bacterium]